MSLARPLALSIASLTITTLGVGVAGTEAAQAAGPRHVRSTIELGKHKSQLDGKVTSGAKACKVDVMVKLHWLQPGTKKWQKVASDSTDKNGGWVVPAPGKTIPKGKYYVTTDAKKGCAGSKSRTISV